MEEQVISIIVPVYNAEKTLPRCVASLTAQTHQYIEIILVNDGSRDSSLAICRRFAAEDGRIRVIDKPNGGVSSARNAGLDAATGEYIMFCDSDDWVEPDWCEALLALYRPGVLPMCGYFCHYADGTQKIISCGSAPAVIPVENFFLVMQLGAFAPWNKLYSSRVIRERAVTFSDRLTLGEDELFVWQYLRAAGGGMVLTDRPLNHYVWPEGSSLTLNLPANYHEQCTYLFRTIHGDILQGAPCSDEAMEAFVNVCYWQFERGLKRIFQNDRLSSQHRLKLSDAFLRSSEYQYLLERTGNVTHPLIRYLCKRKCSLPLYLLYHLKKF